MVLTRCNCIYYKTFEKYHVNCIILDTTMKIPTGIIQRNIPYSSETTYFALGYTTSGNPTRL